MPFGLTNAPSIFQRLMLRELSCLKTEEGSNFVEVHIDDVLIFSEMVEDHLQHIRSVIERFGRAGLKIKPSKCHFLCESVKYVRYLV